MYFHQIESVEFIYDSHGQTFFSTLYVGGEYLLQHGARTVLRSVTKLNGLMRDDGRGRENGAECEFAFLLPREALNREALPANETVKRFKGATEQRKH